MLLPFYKDVSEIPEQYTDLYKKNSEGLFYLQVEAVDGHALEHVAPLKNALTRQKEKVTELTTKLDAIPEDFDFSKYEKDKAKFDTANDFNREKELKELTIEANKNVENEYKSILKGKDDVIGGFVEGMKKSARDHLYSKLIAKGWKKEALQGVVERMTKVEMKDNQAVVSYVNDDGSNMNHIATNGDQRAFSDDDMIKHLSNDETYGRMLPTSANTGNGGQNEYANNQNNNSKVISGRDVGNNLEALAKGTVRLAE